MAHRGAGHPHPARLFATAQARRGEELRVRHRGPRLSPERIGVAVVGAGLMGRRHAENAAWRIASARLAAVFDADKQLASRAAAELNARACASLDELLEADDVRVVVIASPARFHAEQAVAALARGKDVLLEKPMAHTLDDCDRVIAAARRGGSRAQR